MFFKILIFYSHKLIIWICELFFFIISFIPSFLLYFFFKTQLIKVNQKRIGHLCFDVDSFIKENILLKSKKKYILIKYQKNANSQLFNYFKEYLIIVENNFIVKIFKSFFSNPLFCINLSKKYSEGTHSLKMYQVSSKWGKRKPLFRLKARDYDYGKLFMKKNNIDTKKFIVCFHSRSSIFSGGKKKDYGQSFRNFSAKSFEKAIRFVLKNGGVAIRLGDKDNVKIKIKNKNYFDYANYKHKNPVLDIFFCSQAKFFVGNTSGLFGLSSIFGVPVACCNLIPITTSLVYSYKDIGIPMLYSKNGKIMKFEEVFKSKLRNAQEDKIYNRTKKEIKILNNNQDDIKDLTAEKFFQLNNKFKIKKNDINLQKKFKKNFKYGDIRYYSKSNVGFYFLRKYKELI